jgi:Flp pilus assembly protein TadD
VTHPHTDTLLAEALAHQQAGRAAAARRGYDQILAQSPGHADHLHATGLAAHKRGQHHRAITAIGHAVALRPSTALFHHNLGIACGAAGQPAWAERCFARAIELDPTHADSHYNLGAIRLRQGQPQIALVSLCAAIGLNPRAADCHALLGLALLRLGQRDAAEGALRFARTLQQDTPTVHSTFAALLVELGRPNEGEAHYRAALRLAPNDGVVWCNLGILLRDLGRFDEAEAAIGESLRLRPDRPDAHSLRGNILTAGGRFAEAEASYAAALALDPDHADTHFNRGSLHLLTGRLREGWDGFAWRWRRPGSTPMPAFDQPHWDGGPVGTVLLHAEQGFGDTIQMARYIPAIAARCRVILVAPPGLQRLLASLPGLDRVYVRGETLPPFDAHCPLMSLPQILGTTLDTIPAPAAYLHADPAATARWQQRTAALPGRRIGLAWAGNPSYGADQRRSIPPAALAALDTPGCSFVSLQIPAGQPAALPIHDWTGALHDFAETAALIMALDLVISVDTAVAHLAGALGKPVWLLNRYDPCWRWLLHRTDSPWYPSLRQFRQAQPGPWDGVLAAVRAALGPEIA